MLLAHRHRRTIYEKLSPILGDEETEAMLAHFPSTPGEEPATRADLAELRLDLTATIYRAAITALIGGLSIGMGIAAAVGAAFGA